MGRKVVATKAEVAAERSASLARQAGVSNAYTSGLHPTLRRIPLGNGGYRVHGRVRIEPTYLCLVDDNDAS